jgi:predicted RNA-binding protein YlqC (UPF0109 family)
MKDLLGFLLKNILGGDSFEIDEKETGGKNDYIIRIPKDDMGLVIGKGGKTIRMIRNLVRVRATLEKKAVGIFVEEKV